MEASRKINEVLFLAESAVIAPWGDIRCSQSEAVSQLLPDPMPLTYLVLA